MRISILAHDPKSELLRDLVELVVKHGIQLEFGTPPYHQKMLEDFDAAASVVSGIEGSPQSADTDLLEGEGRLIEDLQGRSRQALAENLEFRRRHLTAPGSPGGEQPGLFSEECTVRPGDRRGTDPPVFRGRLTAAAIRRYREARRLTQEALGKAMGYSGDVISSWERGVRKPNRDQRRRLRKLMSEGIQAAGRS